MRGLVTSVVVVGCLALPVAGFQRQGGTAPAAGSALRACSILTRDMVAPFTANKQMLDFIPPEEEPMGKFGSACEYGVVRLQITAGAGPARKAPGPEWQAAPGTGEAAYFRSNGRQYAELMVWSASHYLTLQVGVPTGGTPEALKPDTIALANAILAKLR